MLENSFNSKSSRISLLNSLLIEAEDLLFTFPLPEEVVKKYETRRNDVYSKIGLKISSKIWKMQREAYSKAISSKKENFTQINMYSEIEKVYKLQLAESEQKIEGVKWETIQKIQNSHKIIDDYQEFVSLMLKFIENYCKIIEEMTGIQTNTSSKYVLDEASICFDYENDYESIINEFKNLQNCKANNFNELQNNFKFKENEFNNLFQLLQNEISGLHQKIAQLQGEAYEEKEKNLNEIKELKNKIKYFSEMLTQCNEENEKRLEKEKKESEKIQKKKEEKIMKKYEDIIENLESEKANLNKRLGNILEEYEKSQENYIAIINNLKLTNQELNSDKLLMINNVEKNKKTTDELMIQIEELKSLLTKERNNKDLIFAEKIKIEQTLRQKIEEFQYEIENFQMNHKRINEQISGDIKNQIERYEHVIYDLEMELEKRNQELLNFSKEIEKITEEKQEIYEELNKSANKLDQLYEKIRKLSENNKILNSNLQSVTEKLDEIEKTSKKCYLLIKPKGNFQSDNYFNELVSSISQLLSDKEWLIRKIGELSSNPSNFPLNPCPEVSKSNTSQDFYSKSHNSFQLLKLFEKSRTEILQKFHP